MEYFFFIICIFWDSGSGQDRKRKFLVSSLAGAFSPQEHDVDAFLCLPLGAHFSFPYLLPLSSQVNQTASKDSRAKVVFFRNKKKEGKSREKNRKIYTDTRFLFIASGTGSYRSSDHSCSHSCHDKLINDHLPLEIFFLQEFLPYHDDHHHCITAHVT